ncbi:flagellar motor switch phosphatase FliY [Guptibacillus algicola]|uniref:flagellar motor switch phosphatase FliY n=1 Tax=Guptibacillus algicola TaxID=225844 RepID=UPI001CD759BF|nr:flagellar motor switch phosphatase FliY [Alkalihalobacillus algicola]MCA0988918.1 flagellar motor switch phosphatase FliY [Alkalihalobacillus algicola]
MTDDRLSQEELNALFQETAAGKEGSTLPFQAVEIEALNELFSVSLGTLSTSLSSIFMEEVHVSNIHTKVLTDENITEQVPFPYVEASTRYEGAASGESGFMLNPPDAQDIADIWAVVSGDENEDNVDKSLTSVVTHIMESLHKGLSMASGSSFSGTFLNLQVVSEWSNSALRHADSMIDISFDLSIGSIIQTTVHHVLPAPIGKQITELLVSEEDLRQSTTDEVADEPPLTERTQRSEWKEPERSYDEPVKQPEPARSEPAIQNVQFTNFNQKQNPYSEERNLNMLLDIPLQVTVELGRTKRIVKDILELSHGSILELDKLAGEPVDILINQKLIAKGEVVVIDENFGVRVTDILSAAERLSKLR